MKLTLLAATVVLISSRAVDAFTGHHSSTSYTSISSNQRSSSNSNIHHHHHRLYAGQQFARPLAKSTSTTTTTPSPSLGPPLSINLNFPGLKLVHSNPDVYTISNFLDPSSCADLIKAATIKKLAQSPVAYAGWTTDLNELLGVAAKGPVSWAAIGTAWWLTKDDSAASIIGFLRIAAPSYLLFYVLAAAAVTAYLKTKANELQSMRTSTSTTLDDLSNPDR
jgi:hypothetical protein